MEGRATVHKAGALKQHNKPFKSGRHASKGSIRRQNRGKVSRQSIKGTTVAGNASRKRAASLLGAKKKKDLLFSKRLGSSAGPPKIIGIISLGAAANLGSIVTMLVGDHNLVKPGPLTLVFSEVKQRFTLFAVPRDIDSVLDVAKVADIILFVIPVDGGVDHIGESFISLIKAQGLPAVLTVIQGLDQVNEKSKKEIKKQLKAFLEFQFPDNARLLPLDQAKHAQQVLRFLATIRVKQLSWREHRPYILVDALSFIPSDSSIEVGTLCASGYLRGGPLCANDLVYVPDFGDYQLIKIEGPPEPTPFHRDTHDRRKGMDAEIIETNTVVLSLPDEKQEPLISEIVPDVMANEQNWGDEDDADLLRAEQETARRKKKVPAGTSEYQAAWIFESDDEGSGDSDMHDDGDVDEDDDMQVDSREVAEGDDDVRSEGSGHDDIVENDEDTECLETAQDIDMEQAQRERERLKAQNEEDLEFPDEVDTPEHIKAKLRFQKYRGLKSFRHSPWDPKENLPLDYARIFQFQNFKRTCERVLEDRDGVPEGSYVKLHVAQVPASIQNYVAAEKPFILSGLFKHEHKISVLNFVLQRHQAFSGPIKSKEPLVFQCGFRRFAVNPIFSQNTTGCDKHKTERFLQPNRSTVATIFGPVTFPPCPLLVFKRADSLLHEGAPMGAQTVGGHWLAFVASGSLLSVDPDRLLLKRIILTGHPFKVHKLGAVIKHMFHNPEDVRWFKPVELWTKHGRKGHIKEPLGTHGLMKCTFDGHLLNHDTVCMSLYKRSFPRWGTTTTIHGALLTSQPTKQPTPVNRTSSGGPALTAEALARFNEQMG